MKAQALYIRKPTQVVMVYENNDLIFAILQIVALSLKSFNNFEELTIEGFVARFCRNYFLRKKTIEYH